MMFPPSFRATIAGIILVFSFSGAAANPLTTSPSTPALRYIKDSGICETTPGIHQYSGYVDIGTNMSMWFWFIESRKSPSTAPLMIWLNGGPGCSSMIGMFKGHGPCRVNPDKTTTKLNPYSWNEFANMLYIDQPITTGFSHGTSTVNTTDSAAPQIWTALQVLFSSTEFSPYTKNSLILGSESYGGHYAPSFITYFNAQNARIRSGEVQGVEVGVGLVLVNSGWYDPLIQNGAYIPFATYAPRYGPLQNLSTLAAIAKNYFAPGGCLELEKECYQMGDRTDEVANRVCREAVTNCLLTVFVPTVTNLDPYDLRQNASALFPPKDYISYLQLPSVQEAIGAEVLLTVFVPTVTSLDPYDLRQNASALFPPKDYISYLQLPSVQEAIGAEVVYSDCSPGVNEAFGTTGDNARSQLGRLAKLADGGMRILIWAGDADIICNWIGAHLAISSMSWYGRTQFTLAPFREITLHGKPFAAVKNVDNFYFAKVYDAGHLVAAFQPESAFEIVKQFVSGEDLHSV